MLGPDLSISAPLAPLINDKLNLVSGRIRQLDAQGLLPISALQGLAALSLLLSPAAVAANTSAEQIFSAPGLAAGASVLVNKPSFQAGLGIVGARVSSAGFLAITFCNLSGAPITPTAKENYLVLAFAS